MIVRAGRTLGEGFHRVRGEPHAEIEALEDARARGHDPRGAAMVVTLEPCDHHGLTPPCAKAVIAAGIARVVIGALDPNPKTGGAGVAALRGAGIDVEIADDAAARALIEPFAVAVRAGRPYVTLKMAASIDGCVAPAPGSFWLTGAESRERVRELRGAHDAVMAGAGTVRVDDPQLTVRPLHARRRPYVRVVVCETEPVDPGAAIFRTPEPAGAFRRTIVLAPGGARKKFAALEDAAEVIYVGRPGAKELDLAGALAALKEAGIFSVLCEGGPTLASRLLAAGLVDRLVWFVAPVLLRNPRAVPALIDDVSGVAGLRFDRVERSGPDLMLAARLGGNV